MEVDPPRKIKIENDNISVNELKESKRNFEHNIAVFICEEIENFRAKTDLAISSINIFLNEISSIGESKYYQVDSVNSEIDL